MVIININIFNYLKNFTGVTYNSYGKAFRKNNQFHRYYGPAIFSLKYKIYYFNNKSYGVSKIGYKQKQFFKNISKLWLL